MEKFTRESNFARSSPLNKCLRLARELKKTDLQTALNIFKSHLDSAVCTNRKRKNMCNYPTTAQHVSCVNVNQTKHFDNLP